MNPKDRRARTKFLAQQRLAMTFLANAEVRPYRLGGWAIYVRGTKTQIGRIKAGALGFANALIATCEYHEFKKKPPRKLKRTMRWSGTRRPDGSYIPVAERRAKAMSIADATQVATAADPPTNDVTDIVPAAPHIDTTPIA